MHIYVYAYRYIRVYVFEDTDARISRRRPRRLCRRKAQAEIPAGAPQSVVVALIRQSLVGPGSSFALSQDRPPAEHRILVLSGVRGDNCPSRDLIRHGTIDRAADVTITPEPPPSLLAGSLSMMPRHTTA